MSTVSTVSRTRSGPCPPPKGTRILRDVVNRDTVRGNSRQTLAEASARLNDRSSP